MTKPTLTVTLVILLALSSGCQLFRKKDRVKENPAISSEVEATFRQRWLEKRVAELTAQGIAADAARAQAEQEFRERFQFGTGVKK